MHNNFFKVTTIVLTLISIILAAVIIFRPSHDCSDFLNKRNDIISETIPDTPLPIPDKPTPPEGIEEEDVHLFCHEYADTAMAHTEWIDGGKFLNSYIMFLKNAVSASDNEQLDVTGFRKLCSVYASVSECMLTRSDELYDDVVYKSWLNITYNADVDNDCNENSFTNEYRQVIVEEIEILEKFEKNPTVYPFSDRW